MERKTFLNSTAVPRSPGVSTVRHSTCILESEGYGVLKFYKTIRITSGFPFTMVTIASHNERPWEINQRFQHKDYEKEQLQTS